MIPEACSSSPSRPTRAALPNTSTSTPPKQLQHLLAQQVAKAGAPMIQQRAEVIHIAPCVGVLDDRGGRGHPERALQLAAALHKQVLVDPDDLSYARIHQTPPSSVQHVALLSDIMLLVGVDVGGTFTDVILADLDSGSHVVHKVRHDQRGSRRSPCSAGSPMPAPKRASTSRASSTCSTVRRSPRTPCSSTPARGWG